MQGGKNMSYCLVGEKYDIRGKVEKKRGKKDIFTVLRGENIIFKRWGGWAKISHLREIYTLLRYVPNFKNHIQSPSNQLKEFKQKKNNLNQC